MTTKKLMRLFLIVLAITCFMIPTKAIKAAETGSELKAPKLKSKKSTKDSITIKWKKVSGATGYYLYKYDPSKKQYVKHKTLSGTSCKLTGLKSSTTYKFKLSSYTNKSGKVSESKLGKAFKVKTKKAVTFNAPDFTVYDESGKTYKLSDKAGKPIIINMWATWCGPCVNELPGFEEMYKKYGEKVQFMMINTEDRSDLEYVKSFIDYFGYTFPVYYDWDMGAFSAYGTGYIPVTVAINSSGEVVYNQIGSMDESTLESIISGIID